jgi:hypothetical protein
MEIVLEVGKGIKGNFRSHQNQKRISKIQILHQTFL